MKSFAADEYLLNTNLQMSSLIVLYNLFMKHECSRESVLSSEHVFTNSSLKNNTLYTILPFDVALTDSCGEDGNYLWGNIS